MKRDKIVLFSGIYLMYLLLSIFALRKLIISGNMSSINSLAGDPRLFSKLYLQPYSWNYHLTRPNQVIQLFSHLFYVPFVALSDTTKVSMFQILPWIYSILYSLAGFSMFYLVYTLLTINNDNYTKSIGVLLPSILSGIYYMTYPFFSIGELTEIFVVFGFSMFPFVVLYFIKGIQKNCIRCIILSAIVGTYSGFVDIRYIFNSFTIYVTYTGYYILSVKKPRRRLIKRILLGWATLLITFMLIGGLNLFVFAFSQSEATNVPLNKEAYLITWKEGSPLHLISGFSWFLLPHQIEWDKFPISENEEIAITIIILVLSLSLPLITSQKTKIPIEYYYFGILLSTTLVIFSSERFITWIVLKSPENFFIGRMFRTPRIPAQIIGISTSVLFGLSMNIALNKFWKFKLKVIMFITILILIMAIVTLPFFWYGTINKWLLPFDIPQEYQEAQKVIQSSESTRVIWFPLAPPKWYSPKSGGTYFYVYNSEAPTILPLFNRWTYWTDFMMLSKNSLLKQGQTELLLNILKDTNIKYLIVSNDTIISVDKSLIKYLNTKSIPKFNNTKYYIYETCQNSSEFLTKPRIIIGGGLKTLEDIYPLNFFNGYVYSLLDDSINKNTITTAKIIILPFYSNTMDIMIHFINNSEIYIPSEYNKEGARYPTNPHHGEWTPFISRVPHRWEYPYKMNYGFFTFDKVTKINIPIQIKSGSTYLIFARVLKSPEGGELEITINNKSTIINTQDQNNEAHFVWTKIGEAKLQKGTYILEIKSISGKNALNLIIVLPQEKYTQLKDKLERILSKKYVIYQSAPHNQQQTILKPIRYTVDLVREGKYRLFIHGRGEIKVSIGNYTYKINLDNSTWYSPLLNLYEETYKLELSPKPLNLIPNPSFERDIGYWTQKSKRFNVTIDNTTRYKGEYSLKVYTDTNKNGVWSWIISKEIKVSSNQKYLLITHMKGYNVKSSHIPIEGYFENLHKWKQLRQCPTGRVGTGTFNWTEFKCTIKIPENVTKIRVVLNAGWVLDPSKGPAITWFDDIEMYPLDELPTIDSVWLYSVNSPNETLEDIFKVNETPATVQNYTKINPTLWKVKVNATKPFFLTFAESYDPLWEAKVYKDGKLVEKVKPVPVYGVINGFWINQTGNLTIVLRYTPQGWFELGLKISLTTFILSVFYIIYDWRREKGDRGARKLEGIFAKITTAIKEKIRNVIRGVIGK